MASLTVPTVQCKIFLGFLEKDMTGHWFCDQCLTYHSKPRICPIMEYYHVWPAWKLCSALLFGKFAPCLGQTNFPFIQVSPSHGSDSNEWPSFWNKAWQTARYFLQAMSQCFLWKVVGINCLQKALIVPNELYVRCQYRLAIPSSKHYGYTRQHVICPHIRSSSPENPMTPIVKCLLTHWNRDSCEKCKGLRQCRSCTT